MKKLAAVTGSIITALITPVRVLAAGNEIQIISPNKGFSTIGNFITNAITVVLAISILIVLVMLIWGAFEWITSGGDKDTVGKARGRIINALIGLAVLAVAFALARVGAQFVGFNIENLAIPTPNPNASGL